MPAGKGQAPSVLRPVKTGRLGQKESEGRLLEYYYAKRDPCCARSKAQPCLQAEADSQALQIQTKKKSRKHQRFMKRRALLEQRGLLGPKLGQKVQPVILQLPEADMAQEPLAKKTGSCGQPASVVHEQPAGETHAKLTKWKQVRSQAESDSSEGPAGQRLLSPPQDLACRLSLPGSSKSGRVSLSCSLQRPWKYVAIDCEMVGTGPGGKLSELARCTVVSYNGDVVYDKYIRPELPIVDYRTRWSGITKRHLQNATPFKAAQREVLQILKGKIVVGHAIHNDFQALKYFHPKEQTRDTSRIPLLNQKAGFPLKASVSLKSLAQQLLHTKIQVGRRGHSSVEDAQTSMELYRLVEEEWEQKLASSLPHSFPSSPTDSNTDSNHYLDDQYWPTDLNIDCI
ncbi:PREDICTED: apoptosis-enhancing nuclease-like [Gavialis gangeticus]|uniref:apoptosis-enhancing nuclease-like n=1 Tax=Gavialis gangeticus TaxID=94835 RepID=UPI00092E30FB|nr:PREDICTED: apoptosis-enhancing nuclease-like [Gavialis gangeticus]